MIGVAVAGLGVVGMGVCRMLTENAQRVESSAGQKVLPLYGVDIREMELPAGMKLVHDLSEPLADANVKIVVETIGGVRAAYEYTKQALSAGKWVVTSNKELVATHGDALKELAAEHGARYLYEASVGGGVPIVRPLDSCLSGNNIEGIDGIVNGSTNYLLTRMDNEGIAYDEALADAKKLGYVEANPAADVEGWDARRKLAILANAAFGSRLDDEKDIPTMGISSVTQQDFAAAMAFGGTVRLIAHAKKCADGWRGWVHPAFVSGASPLYAVRDVFNGILVHGDCVGDVLFYGRGAGSLPTASAVVGDIIDATRHMQTGRTVNTFTQTCPFLGADETKKVLVRVQGVTRQKLREVVPNCEIRAHGDILAVLCTPDEAEKLASFEGAGIALYVL